MSKEKRIRMATLKRFEKMSPEVGIKILQNRENQSQINKKYEQQHLKVSESPQKFSLD